MTPFARLSLPAGGRYPIGYIWRIDSSQMSGALAPWAFPQPGHYQVLACGFGGRGGNSAAFEYAGAGAGTAGQVRVPWSTFWADTDTALQHRLTTYGSTFASNVEVRMAGKATVTCAGGQHGGAPSGTGGTPNGGNMSTPGGAGQVNAEITSDLIAAWLGRIGQGSAGAGGASNGASGGGGGGYGGLIVPPGVTADGISYAGQTGAGTPMAGATGAPGGIATGYGAGGPGAGGSYSAATFGGQGNPGVILIMFVGA